MKARLILGCLLVGALTVSIISLLPSQPSFNGTTTGCGSGGGCHTFQSGIISVVPIGNLQVQVSLPGITANVAGELVDTTGAVVDVLDKTSSNPFTLTAPRAGSYTVNAGYKDPQRRWDSLKVSLSLTDVDDLRTIAPDGTFALYQNYPNPFNPSTVIAFVIPRTGFVTLSVYTSLGEEVAQIVHEELQAGSHQVTFENPGLASGVYYYRLQAGEFAVARKFLVVK